MNRSLVFLLLVFLLFLSGCSTYSRYSYSNYRNYPQPRTYSADRSHYNAAIDAKAYKHPTMRPYVRFGVKYYPREVNVGDVFYGVSSWYGPDFHGNLTSNGERYDMYAMTAAHKTFPMNTVLKVTNRDNGLSVVVRVNDRGPFVKNRIIDLSNSAARKIKMVGKGTANVKLQVLGFYSKNKKKITKKVDRIATKYIPKKEPSTKLEDYSLQIASFSNIEGAMGVQEKFNNTDGYKTIIKDIENDSGRFFKVYLIGFKSEKEVRDYKLSSQFQNAFIVKED